MVFPVNEGSLDRAAGIIRAGGIVAFPTETVYGLGGDAFNPHALAKIFAAKERPFFDPLIVHIASMETLDKVARLSALTAENRARLYTLAEKLWPGPLTLILPKRPEVPGLATADLATVAVRFPSHAAARELIRRSAGAVAAPSANRFGRLSPTRAEHVAEQLGDRVDMILDGGRSAVGLESTVLDLSSGAPEILRPGGVSRETIEAALGESLGEPLGEPLGGPLGGAAGGGGNASPGRLKSHYAPRTPLLLNDREEIFAMEDEPGSGWLFFDGASRDAWLNARDSRTSGLPRRVRTLSETGDSVEAAANLFESLHELDATGLSLIHAERAPDRDLGPAINDRLFRAAGSVRAIR
jgi:L-threonylcarbamoyladenylate synthase